MGLRHWRYKGLLQAVLSRLPGGGWVNDRLQLWVGGLRNFEDNVRRKVGDWVGLMRYLRSAGCEGVAGWRILEIGTGWYPTLPVCFALAGAGPILTVDLNRHVKEALTFRMLRALGAHLDAIAPWAAPRARARPKADQRGRVGRGQAAGWSACQIEYRAPQDAARLEFVEPASFDMVYSNSVLEHVRPEAIPLLMKESWRVLKPGGLMVHAVACNDHYAHFDRSISFLNYLQYTEKQWRRWNNRLNYQNRLRAPDFLRYAREAGFRIVHEARAVRPGSREALAKLRLAPEFRHYSWEDLVATSVDFVARKQP
ncbi:MAG: class I SAM-dependent methyltransferase [Bryobacteraceae bacterium]|nr:class I SAM-dependent methyltransferase [Bryobacteraceae bacterium]